MKLVIIGGTTGASGRLGRRRSLELTVVCREGRRNLLEYAAVARVGHYVFDELIRQGLRAHHDPRPVIGDLRARYFGAELSERSLIPAGDARLVEIRLHAWLEQPVLQHT
jgi:hypothetical protein